MGVGGKEVRVGPIPKMETISHERPWDWSVRFGTGLWPWPWVRLGNHGRHKRKEGARAMETTGKNSQGRVWKKSQVETYFEELRLFACRSEIGLVWCYMFVLSLHLKVSVDLRCARRNRKRFGWTEYMTTLKICHWPPHSLEDKVCSAHSLSNFLPLFSSTPFTHLTGNAFSFLLPNAFLAHTLPSGSPLFLLHLASPVYLSNLNASMTF